MLNTQERTDTLFKRLSGLSRLHLVRKVILGVLTVQVLTAVVLLVIAALGKRRRYNKVSERILAPLRFMM